jgi:hypothetical protein
VEFSLVFYLYLAVFLMLIIHGSWLYNNFQADRAARHGALYYGTTNNANQARAVAAEHLNKTQVFSTTKNISVYWSGSVPVCRVETEMKTFFPGIPKLFSPSNPVRADKIPIVKEAMATGEHKYTHSGEYN